MTHFLREAAALLVILALLAGMLPVPSIAQFPPEPHYRLVRVYYRNRANLNDLAAWLDIWEVQPVDEHTSAPYLIAWISADEFKALQSAGYQVETLPYPAGRLETIPGYPCYRTIAELYADLNQIVAEHPDLTELIDVGDSWDKSTPGGPDGHDLYVLKITNEAILGPKPVPLSQHKGSTGKPRFFLMANIHGRELITPEAAMAFVETLTNSYGRDPDVTWVLNHREVHVMVSANPDGHAMNEPGEPLAHWRKNTNSNECGTGSYGVDLNRNASFKWGSGGSSSDPCTPIYRGTGPASEPEEQVIEAYVRSIIPDQRAPLKTDTAPITATGILISLHSFGNLVLWPWGHTSTPAPNSTGLNAIGTKLATYNGYAPKQAFDLYPMSGTTEDWCYGELGVPAFLFEIGRGVDGFYPLCSRYDALIQPNIPAFLYAAKIADTPYRTVHGPDARTVRATPGAIKPGDDFTLSAIIDDRRNGWLPIATAEYFIDTPGEEGAGIPMTAADGAFDSVSEVVTALVSTGTTGLSAGRHLLLVRGQDSAGNWGPFTAAFLHVLSGNEGVLQGTVTDADSSAPPAATVQLSPGGWSTDTDPATGEYRFSLPADTYAATATAERHHAVTTTGLIIADGVTLTQDLTLEPARPILLVDDDRDQGYEVYYTATLDALGWEYDVWSVVGAGSPSATDLAPYHVVIWFTGRDASTTLTNAEQSALASFLNDGGRLFLTGQDIGYDIHASMFYTDCLHADYILDSTNVITLTGSDIFAGQTICISGGDGANNQDWPSEIAPVDADATPGFTYDGAGTGALKAASGTYRLIYFAFGFEGINSVADRQVVMETVLDYLIDQPAMSTYLPLVARGFIGVQR